MNAPRSALGKSNKRGKSCDGISTQKRRSLKMPVREPLFFSESPEWFLARFLVLICDKAVTVCIRVNISG
jgi:hypothetical protein